GLVTHTFGLSAWRDAFAALADQAHSGGVKVSLDPPSWEVAMARPRGPLSPDEITAAVAAVRATGRLNGDAWFSTVTIDDARRPGVSGRRARVVAVPGPKATLVEATVDLATGEVAGWVDHDGVRPALGFGESLTSITPARSPAGWTMTADAPRAASGRASPRSWPCATPPGSGRPWPPGASATSTGGG